MKTLHLDLPGGAYPIHIGAGALAAHLPDTVAGLLEKSGGDLAVIVTNATVEGLYSGRLEELLAGAPCAVETCRVPDGEQYKTLDSLSAIYDKLMALEANRGTVLIAFGGGVVGDMAGFAAATFMRGVPVVQVPTTLLAQVDSSVGGKTAVNHPLGKNSIGAFKQPAAVVMELEFLATLPERELRAGLFELIKHGIIRDLALLDFLEANRARFVGHDWDFWEEAVSRSCGVKAEVVREDEREAGPRALLNFGHSLGHLIETHTGYDTYLHGEAVGVGMLFAAYVSREWGHLPPADFQRVRELLTPLVTRVRLPPLDAARFGELLMHDKKASRRAMKFILLEAAGRAFIRPNTTPEELRPLFRQFLRDLPEVMQVGEG